MTHTPVSSAERPGAGRTSLGAWLRVGVLLCATFTVVTSEMVSIGLLTPLAADLGAPTGIAGLGLTVTGLATALIAPFAPTLAGRLDRRFVVALSLGALAAGNLLAALATDVVVFLVSRLILAVGIAGVWSLAGVVASRLVAPRHAPLALSVAVAGVAAASVVGVPLGTALGAAAGWRTPFLALTAVAVVVGLAIVLTYPPLPRPEPVPGASRIAASVRGEGRRLASGFAVIGVLVTAQFTAYAFVRPILERAGLDAPAIVFALFGYGIAGLVGTISSGPLAARRPRRTVITIAVIVASVLTALAAAGTAAGVTIAALLLWGVGYGGLSAAGQIWLTRAAPGREEQVTASYVGLFNAAIAAGSLAGALLIDHGLPILLGAAAGLAIIAVALAFTAPNPRRPPVSTTKRTAAVNN